MTHFVYSQPTLALTHEQTDKSLHTVIADGSDARLLYYFVVAEMCVCVCVCMCNMHYVFRHYYACCSHTSVCICFALLIHTHSHTHTFYIDGSDRDLENEN